MVSSRKQEQQSIAESTAIKAIKKSRRQSGKGLALVTAFQIMAAINHLRKLAGI